MSLFNDHTIRAMEAGLDAVAERQRVTAHNIANVSTPGFRATRISFEESLRDAIADRDAESWEATYTPTTDGGRFDGNNVNLEEETAIFQKDMLHYEALVQGLNYRLRLYRTAIGR